MSEERDGCPWHVEPSEWAKNTHNPIRAIVDKGRPSMATEKRLIALALGDPTVYLKPPKEVTEALQNALLSPKAYAYPPAIGHEFARAAIAERDIYKDCSFSEGNVVIASGCSGALEMAIVALCSTGSTLAIPKPGFTLYRTIALSRGIKVYEYRLLPDRHWEIDLAAFDPPADCRAWVINNPSNPCGSVYCKQHLLDILRVAEKMNLPIISDEIYEDMTFENNFYTPLASLSTCIPILTCGGLAKRFLVPGWRLGWVIASKSPALNGIRKALNNLATIILGANAAVQTALPDIFTKVPRQFFTETNEYLQSNAKILTILLRTHCNLYLEPIEPQGAMYMMARITEKFLRGSDVSDDFEFCARLLSEEAVSALPGSIFGLPSYIRLVFAAPPGELEQAVLRIKAFLSGHFRP